MSDSEGCLSQCFRYTLQEALRESFDSLPPACKCGIALILVLCFATVLVIEEFGIGSGSTSCSNADLNLSSQSLMGTVVGSVTTGMGIQTASTNIYGTFAEKFDMELWNFRSDLTLPSITMKMPNGKTLFEGAFQAKAVFNASAKRIVLWWKLTDITGDDARVNISCSTHTFESLPPPEALSAQWKTEILPKLQSTSTSQWANGTMVPLCQWTNVHAPFSLPLSGITVTIGKDFLKSASANFGVIVNRSAGPIATKGHLAMEVSEASAGGPEKADLDYSDWGKCSPVKASSQPGQGSSALSLLQFIGNFASFREHMLATGEASWESQQTTVLI